MLNNILTETLRKRASREHPFTDEERNRALHRVAEKVRLWASAHYPSNESETLRRIQQMQLADEKLNEAIRDLDSEFRSEVPPTPRPEQYRPPMCWPRPRRA